MAVVEHRPFFGEDRFQGMGQFAQPFVLVQIGRTGDHDVWLADTVVYLGQHQAIGVGMLGDLENVANKD